MALITNCWLYDLLLLTASIFLVIYVHFKRSYQYWKKKGIPEARPPSFPFGNYQGASRVQSMDLITADLYKLAENEKVCGVYMFNRPILLVRDLEVVKDVMVKEFASFHDRGFFSGCPEIDPLSENLFLLNGQEWRNIRTKLTPTFTSGKMKMMFPTLLAVGEQLIEVLDKEADEPEVEIKDILARYTTDVISSVAFGLDSNSLKNPDCEFRRMGLKLSKPGLQQILVGLLLFAWPGFQKYLPFRFIEKDLSDFFISTVSDVMDYRVKNNVQRNDFLQLLLQLKTLGYIPDADNPNKEEDAKNATKFTIELAAAQAFLFFFAGFETSSSTMIFTLYELALNPELQTRVQEEISRVTTKHGGSVTYEAQQELELLDRVVSETLRKYPVASILMRECNKDYKIPDSDITIEKGMSLFFSLYGIHHDPENYSNPERFDPDRFLPEEKEKRHHNAYMPFGDGPRNCIGNRFGLMQTKAGLTILLSKFNVSPSKKTPIPLEFDPKTSILGPKDGMYLKLTRR